MTSSEIDRPNTNDDEFPSAYEIACRAHDIALRNLIDWRSKEGVPPGHIEFLEKDLDRLHERLTDKL